MPPPDILHQLGDLDQSMPEFPNHLTGLLDGQEYRDCLASLQHDDPARLTEYLDTVGSRVARTIPSYKSA
jgi:hypothetical protein